MTLIFIFNSFITLKGGNKLVSVDDDDDDVKRFIIITSARDASWVV